MMNLFESAQNLFGLNIRKTESADNKSASFALPIDDDGGQIVATASGAAHYGVYFDIDGASKNDAQQIVKYREISLFPEIDIAIQDIINEAIPNESDTPQLSISLDKLNLSDNVKEKIIQEFNSTLKLLKYNEKSTEIFRRWYVDGRLHYHIIVDKTNIKNGILEVRPIDATKIKKVKEVKKEKTPLGVDNVVDVEEYFIYNDAGFANTSSSSNSQGNVQGLRISADAIVYVPSGYIDYSSGNVLSYLAKAIRPVNQLRMLEDATIVYFIARAPERRIFYIDVGNLPKLKAEQYVKDIMNRYRNKVVYDAKTGEVRDDKRFSSMIEDYWMPRRDGGKGTEITTLDGASNQSGMLQNVEYFQKKLYQALNVPLSRLQPDTGFNLGQSTEISRDEVKFQKFIDTLRKRFSQLFLQILRTQLILKGICNDKEWDSIKEKIFFQFQTDNFFSELKNQEVLNSRVAALAGVNQYLGIYFSKEWVQKNVLMMDDEEITTINQEIEQEKDDQTATIWGQQTLMAPPMPDMGMDQQFGGDQAQAQPAAQQNQSQPKQEQPPQKSQSKPANK